MNGLNPQIFDESTNRIPLLTDRGRSYLGLENSKSPEIVQRARQLFSYLDGMLGFPNNPEGKERQTTFNLILKAAYPEIMIDLADLIYVQHERPAIFLNFDHININLQKDGLETYGLLDTLNKKMDTLFFQFARALKNSARFRDDPEIVRLLSESYSYYVHQTKNFPWEDPLQGMPETIHQPVVDIATGLTGFSMIHFWARGNPTLYLTDNMPFIVQGLNHYKTLSGKSNVEILDVDFPNRIPQGLKAGLIMANKILHHLKRAERKEFLVWALNSLENGGQLSILDSDLEHQILRQARDPDFHKKLITGFPETLVEIEGDFCETLVSDVRNAGFKVEHFDFHEYMDETDAYSQRMGDNISLKFLGFELIATGQTTPGKK